MVNIRINSCSVRIPLTNQDINNSWVQNESDILKLIKMRHVNVPKPPRTIYWRKESACKSFFFVHELTQCIGMSNGVIFWCQAVYLGRWTNCDEYSWGLFILGRTSRIKYRREFRLTQLNILYYSFEIDRRKPHIILIYRNSYITINRNYGINIYNTLTNQIE